MLFAGQRRIQQSEASSPEVSAAIANSKNPTQASRDLLGRSDAGIAHCWGRTRNTDLVAVSLSFLRSNSASSRLRADYDNLPARVFLGTSFDLYTVAGYTKGQDYSPYIQGHIAGHAAENASAVGQLSATLASAGKLHPVGSPRLDGRTGYEGCGCTAYQAVTWPCLLWLLAYYLG